jgi:hypothetical protein
MNEHSPLHPALEHIDVIDDYADQAQTATRNITALLQSL